MNLNSILLTDSPINRVSGGGIVSLNLLEVLQEVSDVKLILSGQHFENSKYGEIPSYCIKPEQFDYSDPFFSDYFAKALIEETNEPLDLAISYGCPWGNTFEKLKKDYFCKLIADLAPHNISISRAEHLKWTNSYNYPHLINEFLWGVYSKHLRLADIVVTHSKQSSEYIKNVAKLEREPTVIPHGTYIPDKITPYPKQFSPAYMSSLGFDKGIVYLIKAIINLKTKLIIGGQEATNFNRFLEAFGLQKEKNLFKVTGHIPDLADFYKQVSVLIAPSVTEGFGICGLEAMAYGKPVIVSTGTGVAELIEDGKEGFVIGIRDPKAIYDKIQYFIDNPSEVQRMGKEARKTAEKYTWDKIRKQYITIYKELLE